MATAIQTNLETIKTNLLLLLYPERFFTNVSFKEDNSVVYFKKLFIGVKCLAIGSSLGAFFVLSNNEHTTVFRRPISLQ